MELSGSLGDLGTILPLALGMVLVNDMDPRGVFFCFGLYYLVSGYYFKVTTPVEPMKVIAAYALANGFGEHVGILSVGLVATVAATLLIVPYIGRIMDGSSVPAAG